MEVLTLTRFVHALRSAEVPVSPAETLDGFEIVQQIGIRDPYLLKNALALAFAKSQEEKARFAECFERFFHQLAFQQPARRAMLRDVDADALQGIVSVTGSEALSGVVREILEGEKSALAFRVQTQAAVLEVASMQNLRDKSRLIESLLAALGGDALSELISSKEPTIEPFQPALRYLRQYMQEQVRSYADAQYQIHVDASGKRALLAAALKGNLSHLPPDYFGEFERVVKKLAERLAQNHRRRRRRAQRGMLDIKRTIRENVAYDGVLFNLKWRQKRVEKSAVYVVCDVSNSVASIARFLLLFMHGLTDVLPKVRAFAFSSSLGEITEQFKEQGVERAVEEAMFDWGKGTTDYGQAMVGLRDLIHEDLNHRSTLIILGDARGNYFDPRVDVFKHLSQRAKQVFWLNPETRDRWSEGDSDMQRYAAYCQRVDLCRDLKDIERFADRLLTASR